MILFGRTGFFSGSVFKPETKVWWEKIQILFFMFCWMVIRAFGWISEKNIWITSAPIHGWIARGLKIYKLRFLSKKVFLFVFFVFKWWLDLIEPVTPKKSPQKRVVKCREISAVIKKLLGVYFLCLLSPID